MFKSGKVNLTSSGGGQYRSQVRTFVEFCADHRKAFSGSVQRNELGFLHELISMANTIDGPIVEIGVLFGFTTQHIASWKTIDKKLIAVDDFSWNPIGFDNETHLEFTKRILYYLVKHANTRLYNCSNTEFYRNYQGKTPSMVFIDASHRYRDVFEDIRWAKESEIPIISGHDYGEDFPGVFSAVNEAFGKENVKTCGSVWAFFSHSQVTLRDGVEESITRELENGQGIIDYIQADNFTER